MARTAGGPYEDRIEIRLGAWFVRSRAQNSQAFSDTDGEGGPGRARRATADAVPERGSALSRLNRFDETLASYDHAIAIDPGNANAFYNRGVALQGLRRIGEALASYLKATSLKPD